MKNLSFDNLISLLFPTVSASLIIFAAYRFREMRIAIRRLSVIVIILTIALVLIHFPYDSDSPAASAVADEVEKRYTRAFAGELERTGLEEYFAWLHEERKREVADFVERYGLKQKCVLEVGAGTGYLQDLVEDYTGLDIAPPAQRFFHKPFVVGSATALPFHDNEFDAFWSIDTFEHVINPERGFVESRRVLRNGGLI